MQELDNDLQTFFKVLRDETSEAAYDPDHGGLRLKAFANVILSRFEEAGLVESACPAYFKKNLARFTPEIHAYAIDTDDDILTLFLFIECQDEGKIAKSDIDAAYRHLKAFFSMASSGELDEYMEVSQPVYELVCLIKESRGKAIRTVFAIVTNGVLSERATMADDSSDHDTWDLLRLFRTFGAGLAREPINVNFEDDYGGPLPCLVTPQSSDSIQAYLACIPGVVLAKLYERYRSRILERNVRSFLQFKGKVNKGIRDTILACPERFLPYNNGISATASKVITRSSAHGLAYLLAVEDLQIVNGGQTTASLASCTRRDGADLSAILVQMKLTMVPPNKLDDVVPEISRCANTQNRIQESDFSANHPYHIEVEKLSRLIWTSPTTEMPRGTRWFYERSRGQYEVDKYRNAGVASQKRFVLENPRHQRFSKTDLAKYMMSWDLYPQRVSLGAQKNFMAFMDLISKENRPPPDEIEFKRIVSIALLFKRAEHLYSELGYTGYRANVVAYTLANLSYRTKKHMDWDTIWQDQKVPDEVIETMKSVMIVARNIILSPPSQQNITEWCKKDACWLAVLKSSSDIQGMPQENAPVAIPLSSAEQRMVDAIARVPSGVWLEIATWAKTTDNLQRWQRSIAHSIGDRIARSQKPSIKQAQQGLKIIQEAWKSGFRHEGLDAAALQRIRQLDDSGEN